MLFAVVLGVMYVKEKDKNQEAAVKQAQLEEEVVAAFAGDNNAFNDEEVQQLVDAKEVEDESQEMKELVQSEGWRCNDHASILFPLRIWCIMMKVDMYLHRFWIHSRSIS